MRKYIKFHYKWLKIKQKTIQKNNAGTETNGVPGLTPWAVRAEFSMALTLCTGHYPSDNSPRFHF
jgi:hypothetical protein